MTNQSSTFKDKWEQNRKLAFEETLRDGSEIFSWILERNGFASTDQWVAYLRDKKSILDGGCGNGRVTALLRRYAPETAEIVGMDLVSAEVAWDNLKTFGLSKGVKIVERDLLSDLSDLGRFDFIYCQEVLHHTPDPEKAFRNLCSVLSPGGEIAIYVYKQKAPVREFVDDYVRDKISDLSYADAMRVCREITAFGRALAELGVTVKVPRVEVLGIEEGTYDLQRMIYYFFMKCFWNPKLASEENAAINYDYYHPKIATRHTLEEVEEWFRRANLTIVHEKVDFFGITVRGRSR